MESMVALDTIARQWQLASAAPCLSIGVFRRGSVIHGGCYGDSHTETIYQTASLGKHFTAALVLLLAERGERPGLDDAVAPHLPELPEAWGRITLRQLLSHTAGIPAAGYDSLDLACDYSDSQIVRAIVSDGVLDFPPGIAWRYSNAGYVLAGIAIGRRTGTFYGDLLRELIFHPLGMATATVNSPNAPVGYVLDGGNLIPASFVSPTLNRLADGGLTLSLLDFARWEAALSRDWAARLGEMFIETNLTGGEPSGYGLGWFVSQSHHGKIAEHDGSWQGFSTSMIRYLDEGLSAVVLANLDGFDAGGLAAALIGAARVVVGPRGI
jgi:CubicO group peptidase (beta-lactamase class C family)